MSALSELLAGMQAQLHVWEDEEPESDWYTYQREYGRAYLALKDGLAAAVATLDAHRADLAADAVVVSLASRAPNREAMIDHYSVEVIADGVRYSASAKSPLDAAALAKLKIKDAREAREAKAKKAAEKAA